MPYSYNPLKISEVGKDRMRFELGDTQTEGGAMTSILSDEEYEAIITDGLTKKNSWNRIKLKLLEAIYMKLSYQVDTKIDVLTYAYSDRAQLWRQMYEDLKRNLSVSPPRNNQPEGGHYFHAGMLGNKRAE